MPRIYVWLCVSACACGEAILFPLKKKKKQTIEALTTIYTFDTPHIYVYVEIKVSLEKCLFVFVHSIKLVPSKNDIKK